MAQGTFKRKQLNPTARAALILAALALVGAIVILLAVKGSPLRRMAGAAVDTVRAVQNPPAADPGAPPYSRVIFLHHSVGQNLIRDGQVRDRFYKADIDLWDHDYNWIGLTGPDGAALNFSYNVPNDNTDVNGLRVVFEQPVYALPVNTLSALLQYDVIMVKSCFPNNNLTSDEILARDQADYRRIAETMRAHPDKIFIVLTSPPLAPAETNLETAARARRMASWLTSDEFSGGAENIFVFDFYHLLAEDDPASPEFNMLKSAYRNGVDSHPNALANQETAPKLVLFVVQSIDEVISRSK